MSDTQFPYDDWVKDAMRGVLRQALETLAATSVTDKHHLYINFLTADKDVGIPGFLKAQYPEEITIVLQHQFEDLYVDQTGFEVTLSFNGQLHRLSIPFAAVTSFADPSVNFGIHIGDGMMSVSENEPSGEVEIYGDNKGENAQGSSGSTIKKNILIKEDVRQNANKSNSGSVKSGADVINIEAFRNK